MASTLQVFERSPRFSKWENSVDHGLEPVRLDGSVHAGKYRTAAHVDAIQVNGFPQNRKDIDTLAGLGKDADQVNVATNAYRIQRAREGSRAADLDDMICTLFTG